MVSGKDANARSQLIRINGTYILHYVPLPFGPNEALKKNSFSQSLFTTPVSLHQVLACSPASVSLRYHPHL